MSQDMLAPVYRALENVPAEYHGLVEDFAHKLAGSRNGKWAREGKLFLRQEPCWQDPLAELGDTVIIEVNYDLSLEEMIVAGHYDWKNGNINGEHFPIKGGKGIVRFEARYFHFDRDISSEAADKAIIEEDSANPWESSKIEHTLSYGAKYPEEQRKFPIVGLGSSAEVYGHRRVPSLDGRGSGRGLRLGWWVGDWGRDCRFLAVRKVLVTQS